MPNVSIVRLQLTEVGRNSSGSRARHAGLVYRGPARSWESLWYRCSHSKLTWLLANGSTELTLSDGHHRRAALHTDHCAAPESSDDRGSDDRRDGDGELKEGLITKILELICSVRCWLFVGRRAYLPDRQPGQRGRAGLAESFAGHHW